LYSARRCGISYLDGAILGSPEWIGTPACTIFYSGPAEVFNRAKPVLMVFGDRTVFVGHEIGHASAFDVAVLTFGVSAMLGFLQGQVVWESENLPAGGFLETIKGMMPTMESVFTDMSRRVSSKNYSGDQASLEAYFVVTKQLVSWCQDRGHACSRFCPAARASQSNILLLNDQTRLRPGLADQM
jgi:3-hydroxyisobutyrate dehydrogenase-like beta-hydroxyacid dehydrogenase